MVIQKCFQYLCSLLGVISLSFIYVQMFKKTKHPKKD
ncbi:hypothetical protein S101395_02341 [Bacillus sonorensis]|uniref:Uncharacterized protein n=2 Tax=Bacillus sonorensis TaxID=119858 RepID=M5P8M3_9BACI|nr:hypothetical protein S101395_02341 [Bacillus sonorensis]EME76341.1 hypothetical protein BSONL12_01122 [Bacillus sonorensis L12]